MIEYIVELKSGTRVRFLVEDGRKFVKGVTALIINFPNTMQHFYEDNGFLFNIGEIAAVFPSTAEVKPLHGRDERETAT